MTSFTLPAVIDALVTALQPLKTATPPAFVLDGPLKQFPKSDAVVIGTVGESASQRLDNEARLGGLVGYREAVQVTCAAYSWAITDDTDTSTDEVLKPRRDRAMALFEAVRAALDASPTLGGVCERCYLDGDTALIQANDGGGARVSIGFKVNALQTVYKAS